MLYGLSYPLEFMKNEQTNNIANPAIQDDSETPSGNQSFLNQPEAEGKVDTPSPRTPSSRKQQEPDPANPDNAGVTIPT